MHAPKHFRTLAAAGIVAIAVAVSPPAAHARGNVRLHIEVDDAYTGEERVRLNIPLTSVDSILEIIGEEFELDWLHETRARGLDLRQLYIALRDEDLSDFLEVTGEDGEWVKAWKDGDGFHIRAQESGRSEPNVKIYLPLSVLDALFLDGDDETPDFRGALKELRRLAPLTLVEVDDDDERVRVWLE